jgi:predicted deacylase
MRTIKVGELVCDTGIKCSGYLTPVQWYDGSYCKVPVAIINGSREGPTLWIQAASHGNEYQGMGAIIKLFVETKPEELSGALILIPVLNILGFNAMLRSSPVDGMDFNRTYPGAPPERVMHILGHTEVVVHTIVEEIRKNAEYMIDIHDAGPLGLDTEIFYATSPDPEVTKGTRAMAFASGGTVIREVIMDRAEDRKKYPGLLGSVINEIPSITIEVGGGVSLNETYINEIVKQFRNVMKYLNMIPGDPEIPERQTFLNTTTFVRPHAGGILHMQIAIHDNVSKGDTLGTITDFFGNELEVLKSPVDGIVYAFRNAAVVCTGQWCVSIGSEAPKPEM